MPGWVEEQTVPGRSGVQRPSRAPVQGARWTPALHPEGAPLSAARIDRKVGPMLWIIIIVVLVVLLLGGFGFSRRGR